jgi:hypothetical protein
MNLYQPTITGSLSVSGSVNISGSITIAGGGTISGTASYATNAELLDGLDSTVFTLTSSFAAQTASFTAFTASILAQTASLNSFSASVLSYTSSLNAKTSSFATTGSNTFAGTQTISGSILQSGSFTSTGTLTAQTLVVQTITSSVDFVTGSTRFGSLLDNTHVFSGSVSMNPGGLFVSGSGLVGIGTISPSSKLHVVGSSLTDTFRITDASNYTIVMGYSGSANVGMISTLGSTAKLALGTNSAARLTIDGTGNVGIGTSSPNSILEIQKDTNGDTPITFINGSGGSGNTSASISLNFTLRNGSGGSSGGVILKVGKETDHIGANVNDYFAISTTKSDAMGERMRITSGGITIYNHTSSVGTAFAPPVQVKNTAAATGNGYGIISANTEMAGGIGLSSSSTNGITITADPDNLRASSDITFNVDGATKMTITSTGTIDATSNSTTGYSLTLGTTQATSPNVVRFYSATDTNNTNQFIMCDAAASVQRMSVRTNGGIYNYTANNSPLSDERLKKDIIPLESVWNKVKGIEIVKYKFKDQDHDDFNMGVIAQQVETVAPELVNPDGWGKLAEDNTPYKGIWETDINYYSIKALQEAMAKIESQQSLIISLQSRIETLEQK